MFDPAEVVVVFDAAVPEPVRVPTVATKEAASVNELVWLMVEANVDPEPTVKEVPFPFTDLE